MGLVRLILALTVAGDHFFGIFQERGVTDRGIDQWIWLNGGTAVMLFYVISGFLIGYVLDKKYSEAARGNLEFYRSRFIRIFSLYWPLLAIFALAYPRLVPHGLRDGLVSLFIVGGDWVVPFADYPAAHNPYFPFLGQAWSVASELTFYAMAPLVFRSIRLTATLCAVSLAIHIPLQIEFPQDQAWTYHFFPGALWLFMAGDIARRIAKRYPALYGDAAGAAAIVGAIIFLRLTMWKGGTFGAFFYPMVGCFALSLPWLFERTKDHRVMNFFGNLTYPIYLTHAAVIVLVFGPLIQRYGIVSALGLIAAFFCALIVIGAIAHYLIEVPCAAAMRQIKLPHVGKKAPVTAEN